MFCKKYIVRCLAVFLATVTIVSCNRESKQVQEERPFVNDLLSKTASIVYEQEMYVPEEYFFFKSIDFASFVNQLKNKTIQKQVNAYLPFSDIVFSADDIQDKFVSDFHPEQITSMIFDEDWELDTAQFIMNKKVNSYSLVRSYVRQDAYRGEVQTKSIVARYDFSNSETQVQSKENYKLLAKDVAYEVSLVNADNPEFLENIQVKRLAKILVEKALCGNTQSYSFSFRDSLMVKAMEEVSALLGKEVTCYEEENMATGEMDTICVDKDIDLGEICGVAFIEDWYLNESTMEICKDVKGIAPVRVFYHDNGEDTQTQLVKSIPFVMYFKNHDKGK